jgi:hypothetical protein
MDRRNHQQAQHRRRDQPTDHGYEIGERKLGSAAPQPTAIDTMPVPVASVVMMMWRARFWQASISTSKRPMSVTAGWPSLPSCPRRATMEY